MESSIWLVAERGNPNHTLGSDHALPFEVIGPIADGGPGVLAVCYDRHTAHTIMRLLRNEYAAMRSERALTRA